MRERLLLIVFHFLYSFFFGIVNTYLLCSCFWYSLQIGVRMVIFAKSNLPFVSALRFPELKRTDISLSNLTEEICYNSSLFSQRVCTSITADFTLKVRLTITAGRWLAPLLLYRYITVYQSDVAFHVTVQCNRQFSIFATC